MILGMEAALMSGILTFDLIFLFCFRFRWGDAIVRFHKARNGNGPGPFRPVRE